MSPEEWEEFLEEKKAHAKRVYKQSGGRLVLDHSLDFPSREQS
jgi:hypothetical protein